jgi:transposase-like protein
MKQGSLPGKAPTEQVLKDIRRQTRRQYSAEEKIRIVLEGLRGEENIFELCRRPGSVQASVVARAWLWVRKVHQPVLSN